MADKMKLKLNSPGIRALLQSPEVRRDLTERAQRVAGAAGPGAEIIQETHGDRAVVRVGVPLKEEADNGTLSRALGRAGS